MSARTVVWRGIRFARLAHPFAAPEREGLTSRPAPGGTHGTAPLQRAVPGADLGAPTGADCLFLTVCAPASPGPHPVVVWVYGGGFEMGAASAAWLDPAALSVAADAVVVVANHRVGAYGFAHLSGFGGRLADAHDLGLQDVLAALRWVQEHISRFGGDPARVTLGGQSSGAFLSAAAAVAPGAPRLRALACFSGGASRIVAEADAEAFAAALVAHPLIGGADRLVEAEPEAILAAQAEVAPTDLAVRNGARPRGFGVSLDRGSRSPVVPEHPFDRIARGALADTLVLAAATVDEMDGFAPASVPPLGGRSLRVAAAELIGAPPERVTAAYEAAGDEPAGADRAWRRLLTDDIYRLPAVRLVQAQRAAGGVAAYLEVSREDGRPAGHGCENPGILGPGEGRRAADIRRVLTRLVRRGEVEGGDRRIDDGPVAGDPRPAEVLSPEALLDVWEGVARP